MNQTSSYTTIDAYISLQPLDYQPLLQKLRETIKKVVPEAVEKISYQMPTFYFKENIIHFALYSKHLGLYPGGEATTHFATRLKGYKTSKGTIQFPLDQPLDFNLITDIVQWRISTIKAKHPK